jgi:hypothetical protein
MTGPPAARLRKSSMTSDHLTAILAERVMAWRVGSERFLVGNRRWLPRWRFQPTERVKDAYRLLERAAPQEYSMDRAQDGRFWVKVRIAGATGEAQESTQARAVTFAVARAIGLDPEGRNDPKTGVERR